ncbi:DHH family phosphoesterase [Candidatus Kuenenia sp.]|uniref:DHH family phosphoesterase n=1 Tax=Candidatus Kuenenia sp. TaxID=2499824 RepID=UPI00322065B2
MYIILGCDCVAMALVKNLSKSGEEEILVIDKDEQALNTLKEFNITTITADIYAYNFSSLPGKDPVAFIILQKNPKENLALIKRIKELFPDKFVLTQVTDDKESSESMAAGADRAVESARILSDAILNELESAKLRRSASKLVKVLREATNNGLAIFLQNNPDPDAIASGLALKRIAGEYGIKSKIYYGGNIGHQENKALVNLLQTDLIRLNTPDESLSIINSVDKIALIEASIPSKNNILPPDTNVHVIIDHHQTDISLVKGEFVEIMPGIGANSSIMTRYLRYLGIAPDVPLATALRYGIRVDTSGFTRNTTTEDLDAAAYLSPLVDVGLLNQIENPPMSAETMDIIGRAIRNREVRGAYLTSFVEFITDRDALPQAAELMLQMEGISTVLVFGIDKDKVQLSARSVDSRINLASLLQKAFGFMNAGGHATMAAGCIELGIFGDVTDKRSLSKITFDAVRKKFFSAAGVDIEKREIPDDLESIMNYSVKD